MRSPRFLLVVLAAAIGLGGAFPEPVDGQIMRRLRNAAANAAEREVTRQVQNRVTNAVRCAFDDLRCLERAEAEGKEVAYVDDRGQVLLDDDGEPITDRAAAARATVVRPGEGVWANWDFVPGDEVLFVDDYQADRVGDFPRRWELVSGNFEVVEWEGGRYVQVTANGLVVLRLPRVLPERFTVEFALGITHANQIVYLTTSPYQYGVGSSVYQGSAVNWGYGAGGLRPVREQGPEIRTPLTTSVWGTRVVPVRVMADGDHMKVYWDDRRIANAPNAVFPRTELLHLAFHRATGEDPILVGPVRVAAGGLELYDRLARDGRVATQGILFATGSDRIRPESTPVLQEIVAMLAAHPDLRLRIEGHTDDVGDEASNQALSERRAAAVQGWLVESGGVDAARLETVGWGEARPAVEGTSAEAREQNRRVELVDLRGDGGR